MASTAQSSERYTVLGRLGVGGMAEVLLARMRGPQGFARLVVVKRLLPHLREEPEHVAMFLDEARILSRIRHRNVVTVHELLEDAGEYALVMEYLEGDSASAFMKRAAAAQDVDPWLGAYVVAEAAMGLSAAHAARDETGRPLKLIHRDVSPQNVFLTHAGDVKLLDFGVARAEDRQAKTQSGVLKGKLAYMAPEQLTGGHIDQRSDLFALGTVLYELTTGTRLFRRPNELATVHAVCEEPIKPPRALSPSYPPSLEAIVLRALERDPGARYQRADEMGAELRRALRKAPFAESPADRLATRMRALFATEIAANRGLVGASQGADLDDRTESSSPALAGDESRSRVVVTRRWKPRTGLVAGGVALAALVLGVITFAALSWGPDSRAASPAEMPPASLAEPPPPEAVTTRPPAEAPTTVRIDVVTEPPDAIVHIGESAPCVAPCGAERAASATRLEVRAALPGYADSQVTITPDHDQRLRLTLSALPEAPALAPPRTRPRPVEPEPPSAFPVFQ